MTSEEIPPEERKPRRIEEIRVEHGENEHIEWIMFYTNLELPDELIWDILHGLKVLDVFTGMTLLGAGGRIRAVKMKERSWKETEGPAIEMVARKILIGGYAEHLFINGARYSKYSKYPLVVGICPHCKQLGGVEVTNNWRNGAKRVSLPGGGELRLPQEIARMAPHRDKKSFPGNTCRGSGQPAAVADYPGPRIFSSSLGWERAPLASGR